MSHHEGVSCDSCLKGDFRGKRYKCLICFDYDLCSACFESGATSTRHMTDHPMQCILTRSDFELYYGGEAISIEQPQSFTCPFCGKMGLTETTLQEHVTAEHTDTSTEVVCPICASVPGGEPNYVTDDFATHLALEHRSPRELDEPQTAIRGRRAPHPTRGMGSTRARRSQFNSSAGLSSLSPSNRDSMDPIAELLSQLSGVRRAANLGQSHSSQLQQLQMQLQLERHASSAPMRQPFDRAPIERVTRRHQHSSQSQQQLQQQNQSNAASNSSVSSSTQQQLPYVVLMEPSPSPATLAAAAAVVAQANHTNASSSAVSGVSSSASTSQLLLSRCSDSNLSDAEQQTLETQKADRSLFVQELLLTTLTDNMSSEVDNEEHDDLSSTVESERHLNASSELAATNQSINEDEEEELDYKTIEENSISNFNENMRPTNLIALNKSSNPGSQQQQPLHHLQQSIVHHQQRRQNRPSRPSWSIDTNRNANSRNQQPQQAQTTAASNSARRKVLRQPNDTPSSQH